MNTSKQIVLVCLLGLILFGVLISNTKATTEWIQQYPLAFDAHIRSVAQTDDGGYILAGWNSLNNVTASKALLMKLDSSGKIQWYRSYGIGGNFPDEAHKVIQTNDGGYAVAGVTWASKTTNHFWVFKVDSSGKPLWDKTYGGQYNGNAWEVLKTKDGGLAIAGMSTNLGKGEDFWLVKTDASGVMQWNKTYGTLGNDVAYSVIQTADGSYAITGRQNGHQISLIKTNESGDMQWNKTYGGPLLGSVGYSLIQTNDGGYAIGGSVNNANSRDFLLLKTDLKGNMEWNRTYGGYSEEIARSLIQTIDGSYLLAGYTESYGAGTQDIWLVKTDYLGKMQWNQTYGGSGTDVANSLTKTSDGGYLLGGNTESFGVKTATLLIIKTDSKGLSPQTASSPKTSVWVPQPT
jgi:hypothetical protein